MKSEEERQRQRRLNAIASNVWYRSAEEPLPESLPADVENLFWDYAMGLLDPPEEQQVVKLLARSERAEALLIKIRQSMAEAGMAQPIVVPELVTVVKSMRERFEALLARMGKELGSVAGIIVEVGDGLVSALDEIASRPGTTRLAGAPALLGEEQREQVNVESETLAHGRIEVTGPKGLHVSLIRKPDGQVDLHVVVSEPPLDGQVKLLELVAEDGTAKEVEAFRDKPLRGSRAVLEDCPEGVLKIVAPGDRQLVLCLGRGEPQMQ